MAGCISSARATTPTWRPTRTIGTLIVDAAINKVTSLRGRLGAFQRTTLETNIASLNDTVTNLTEAESSIRDADFAAEIGPPDAGPDSGAVGHAGARHRQPEPAERARPAAWLNDSTFRRAGC